MFERVTSCWGRGLTYHLMESPRAAGGLAGRPALPGGRAEVPPPADARLHGDLRGLGVGPVDVADQPDAGLRAPGLDIAEIDDRQAVVRALLGHEVARVAIGADRQP